QQSSSVCRSPCCTTRPGAGHRVLRGVRVGVAVTLLADFAGRSDDASLSTCVWSPVRDGDEEAVTGDVPAQRAGGGAVRPRGGGGGHQAAEPQRLPPGGEGARPAPPPMAHCLRRPTARHSSGTATPFPQYRVLNDNRNVRS